MIDTTNTFIENTNESNESIEQSTSSTDKQHTSVVINNSTSSTSSEELNTQFSLSTIFLPTHNKEKEDGYIDIDGKMVHYDQQNNIFQQLFYSILPCCQLPLFSNVKLEKYIRMIFSLSFLLSMIYICVFVCELYYCNYSSFEKNPGFGPSKETIVNFGAKYTFAIQQNLEIYRLFTSLFLSPNLLTLLVQIFFCLRFFLYFEHKWGLLLIVVSFFITGEAGVLLCCIFSSNNISVCSLCPFVGLICIYMVDISLNSDINKVRLKRSLFFSLIALFMIVFLNLFPLQDFTSSVGSCLIGICLGLTYFLGNCKRFTQRSVMFQTTVFTSLVVFMIFYFIVCCLVLFIWMKPLPSTL